MKCPSNLACITIAIAFPCSVLAARCPDVRLDKTILKHVPTMDQDSSNLCVAYSLAALVDAYRVTHRDTDTKKVTSPIHLNSLNHSYELHRKRIENKVRQERLGRKFHFRGYEEEVRDTLRHSSLRRAQSNQNGRYFEDIFESVKEQGVVCSHYQVSKFLKSTDLLTEDQLEKLKKRSDIKKIFDTREFNLCLQKGVLEGTFFDDLMETRPFAALQTLSSIDFQAVALEKAEELIAEKCTKEHQIKIDLPKDLTRAVIANEPFFGGSYKPNQEAAAEGKRFFRERFSKQKKEELQPIAIGYCQSLLRDRNFDMSSVSPDDCGKHASVVVGSRPSKSNPEKCDYLIRNSWGATCPKTYAWDGERVPGGHIWIEEDSLFKNVTEYVSL